MMAQHSWLTVVRLGVVALALATNVPMARADAPKCQGTSPSNLEASTPTTRFEITDDVVTDKATGLMWTRCPIGYVFDSTPACGATTGTRTFGWKDAIAKAADPMGNNSGVFLGKTGWRVPNIKELASIIEHGCYAPASNRTVFPGTPSAPFWTNSPVKQETGKEFKLAWVVNFGDGKAETAVATYYVAGTDANGQQLRLAISPLYLRLVRDAN